MQSVLALCSSSRGAGRLAVSENDLAHDEAAAADGQFIRAVGLKMAALADRAAELLEPTGAIQRAAAPNVEAWAQAIDDDRGLYAALGLAALTFIGEAPVPPEDRPWPPEFAAAHVLVDLYVFGARFRRLRRRLIGRDSLDVQGMAELVWIAMRLGAMSEAFRAEQYRFHSAVAEARELVAQRERGSRRGGSTRTAIADRWRIPGLALANERRSARPSLSTEALADELRADLSARTGADGRTIQVPGSTAIRKQITAWERAGELPRSKRNPNNAPGEP